MITRKDPLAGRLTQAQAYAFALLVTGGTLCLRLNLDEALDGRPLLIIFILPILLSGYVGGLRAGLLATLLSYGASILLLPPFHRFRIPTAPDHWPQLFVVVLGIVISVLSEAAIRRAHQREEAASALARDALVQAENIQNAIFSSPDFSCIASDVQGIIRVFNPGAEKMFGYTAKEVVGKASLLDLHQSRTAGVAPQRKGEMKPGLDQLIENASRGLAASLELMHVRRDGSRLTAKVTLTALRNAKLEIIGYLMSATDHTAQQQIEVERKLSQAELQETNVKLEAARNVAEGANQAKSEFLSNLSHELRTPLSAVLGFTQLMEMSDPPPTETQAKHIGRILHAGRYLLKLVNEILDLAAIESGKLPLSRNCVPLSRILATCRTMVEPQAEARGVQLIFPRLEAPLFVRADATRLEQILINLLSNAVKYNKDRGTVIVDCVLVEGGRLRIGIRDTGIGLNAEKLAQLFTPFNRLGQEASTIPGTGIGLVVSRRLAELMGGSLGVESTLGEGSLFWCELPSVASAEVAREVSSATQGGKILGALRPCTLLYVGDSPAKLKLLAEFLLQMPDVRLITASNAIQGIRRAQTTRPQAILVDVDLAENDDFKEVKMIHHDPATSWIPLIAMTSRTLPRERKRELEADVFGHVSKPLKIREFKHTLGAALERDLKPFALDAVGGGR